MDHDHLDPQERYEEHHEEALHWLREAGLRNNIEAGRECLWTAQVHATLALAAATANNGPHCGVHCAAVGC